MLSLGEIIGVMEVDDALFMGVHHLLRKEDALCQVLGDLACHVIALRGIDHRILVGVLLLHFLVHLVDQGENSVIRCIRLAGDLSLIAVTHIFLRNLIAAHLHDARLNHVLDILYIHGMG